MPQRRVCDACAVRRVRCDGLAPCAGCMNASLDCTRIRQRHKSGPKGIKQKTLQKLARAREPQTYPVPRPDHVQSHSVDDAFDVGQSSQPDHSRDIPNDILLPDTSAFKTHAVNDGLDAPIFTSWQDRLDPALQQYPPYPYKISPEHLALYLDIYHHKLYPVWPIVDKAALMNRFETVIPDGQTYVLAASVCVATILQLQLAATDPSGTILQAEAIIDEIEDLRRAQDYRERPSADGLRVSFFLHVAYLHIKKQTTSTLTLREAITIAHFLDLHKPSHYSERSFDQRDDDLRMLWLLFITERAHALQYDLPYTLAIPPEMPTPQPHDSLSVLSAFTSLCRMFSALSEASNTTSKETTALALSTFHNRLLQQTQTDTRSYNQLQKADVGVTQHWTRLHLWKLAVSRRIAMTTDSASSSDAGVTSLLFPLRVAHDLLAEVSSMSSDSLEAHGSGMELKLFEFANTVADVMVCMPQRGWRQSDARVGPREYLVHLGAMLAGFRGGNQALLPLLRTRFVELGLAMPVIPRLVDVSYESSEDSPNAGVTLLGDEVGLQWDVDELSG